MARPFGLYPKGRGIVCGSKRPFSSARLVAIRWEDGRASARYPTLCKSAKDGPPEICGDVKRANAAISPLRATRFGRDDRFLPGFGSRYGYATGFVGPFAADGAVEMVESAVVENAKPMRRSG